MQKKYYHIVGDKAAKFAIDADLTEVQVCRIMKCKAVKEISFLDFCYVESGNISYDLNRLCKLRRKKKKLSF